MCFSSCVLDFFFFLCEQQTPQSWVGIMLMKQPFFIKSVEDVEKAKGSAFGAAGMFFFIFCVSTAHLIMDSMKDSVSVVRSTVTTAHDDTYDGWTGQRTNGEYGQDRYYFFTKK